MAKFQLENNEAEEFLVQIITGKKIFTHNDSVFAIAFPKIEERDMGRLIYMKAVKKFEGMGVPSLDAMRKIIIDEKLLPSDYYINISMMESEIKALGEAKALSSSKPQVADLSFQIEKIMKKLYDLKMREYGFLVHTIEMKADDVKLDYLLSKCTLCGDELSDKHWANYKEFQDDSDARFIISAKSNFMALNRGISPAIVRALARGDDWRRRWKASQQTGSNVFPGFSSDWDINKVEICYWSDFYDGIFGYHTPPPETIIEDDEKLFEWIRDVNRINNSSSVESSTGESGMVRSEVNAPYKIRPKVTERKES